MPSSPIQEGLKIGPWQKKKELKYYKTESYLLKTQIPFFGNFFRSCIILCRQSKISKYSI